MYPPKLVLKNPDPNRMALAVGSLEVPRPREGHEGGAHDGSVLYKDRKGPDQSSAVCEDQ